MTRLAVTGDDDVSSTVTRGFLRDADGAITTFDVFGGVWTEPERLTQAGILRMLRGLVAGFAGPSRYADGRITTRLQPPCNGVGMFLFRSGIKHFRRDCRESSVSGRGARRPSPVASGGFHLDDSLFTKGRAPDRCSRAQPSGNHCGALSDFDYAINTTSFLFAPGRVSLFSVPLDEEYAATKQQLRRASMRTASSRGGTATRFDSCVKKSTGGFVRSPEGIHLFNPPGTLVTQPELGPVFSENRYQPAPAQYQRGGGHHGFLRGREQPNTVSAQPVWNHYLIDRPKGRQTTSPESTMTA